ncbi:MAG: TIM barrel protein [Planctomycetaceae bacterium]|jgi:mannonate dehydratase|nr:TIM barrel protein [Planctomycetaceae bacterium]MBT6485070.1 TIM barrel protein [Planctomycetaceae bacterium]MBT6497625.1 TIM barrel protein [Planctomycetaceae bacterium]
MSAGKQSNRRDFIKHSALGAATAGVAAGATDGVAAFDDDAKRRKRKGNIRIGARFNEQWLKSRNDDDLRYFKQLGVDRVDIELKLIDGYAEHGIFTRAALKAFIKRLDGVGLKIERANSLGPFYLNATLNRNEGQREIDKLKQIGEMLAEEEIPVFGIQACQAALHVSDSRRGWVRSKGRGGYGHPSFSRKRSMAASPKPKYKVTSDQLWKGIINIYKQVIPTVEGSKTVIAMHGNDPPLHNYLGNPQILCRFADFDRLFSEVPSKHNGITFCVGTRYESGEDVFEGIRRYGRQGRLFHVHFRNVRGTLPADGGYSEVFVDDGDLKMADVLRTLDEVCYDGVIDFDHPMSITGDQPLPKQYIGFAVGYMRGLLHGGLS